MKLEHWKCFRRWERNKHSWLVKMWCRAYIARDLRLVAYSVIVCGWPFRYFNAVRMELDWPDGKRRDKKLGDFRTLRRALRAVREDVKQLERGNG